MITLDKDPDEAREEKVIADGEEALAQKSTGLALVNQKTGEVVEVAFLVEVVRQMPFEQKLEVWKELCHGGVLRDIERELKTSIVSAMNEVGAKVMRVNGGEVQLEVKPKYKYNIPLLESVPECKEAITYEPKVDKRVLNKLAKLGGAVKSTIDAATSCPDQTVSLNFIAKPQAEVE